MREREYLYVLFLTNGKYEECFPFYVRRKQDAEPYAQQLETQEAQQRPDRWRSGMQHFRSGFRWNGVNYPASRGIKSPDEIGRAHV